VAYVSECILSAIDLDPPRCISKEYRTSRSLLYEWHSRENKAMVLPSDLSSVSRSLHQGSLILLPVKEKFMNVSVLGNLKRKLGHWSLRIGIFPGTLQYFILLFSLNFVIATK